MLAMKEAFSDREIIKRLRDEQLRKLVDNASDKALAEEALRTFYALERQLGSEQVGLPKTFRYTPFDSAVDAIVDYLKLKGEPLPIEEVREGVIDNGFKFGAERRDIEFKIRQSLDSFRRGLGSKNKNGPRVKIINGKAGLGEWDDARFED